MTIVQDMILVSGGTAGAGTLESFARPIDTTIIDTGWQVFGAASAHAAVNEAIPDEDTSYIFLTANEPFRNIRFKLSTLEPPFNQEGMTMVVRIRGTASDTTTALFVNLFSGGVAVPGVNQPFSSQFAPGVAYVDLVFSVPESAVLDFEDLAIDILANAGGPAAQELRITQVYFSVANGFGDAGQRFSNVDDMFETVDGTFIQSHSPRIPASPALWDANVGPSSAAEIRVPGISGKNDLSLFNSALSVSHDFWIDTDGPALLGEDGEWWWDFTRFTNFSVAGAGSEMEVQVRVNNSITGTANRDGLFARMYGAGLGGLARVAVGRYNAGSITDFDNNLGTVPMSVPQAIRFGITLNPTQFTVWWEPFGGGTRTNVGTTTTITNMLKDAAHRRYGLRDLGQSGGGGSILVQLTQIAFESSE